MILTTSLELYEQRLHQRLLNAPLVQVGKARWMSINDITKLSSAPTMPRYVDRRIGQLRTIIRHADPALVADSSLRIKIELQSAIDAVRARLRVLETGDVVVGLDFQGKWQPISELSTLLTAPVSSDPASIKSALELAGDLHHAATQANSAFTPSSKVAFAQLANAASLRISSLNALAGLKIVDPPSTPEELQLSGAVLARLKKGESPSPIDMARLIPADIRQWQSFCDHRSNVARLKSSGGKLFEYLLARAIDHRESPPLDEWALLSACGKAKVHRALGSAQSITDSYFLEAASEDGVVLPRTTVASMQRLARIKYLFIRLNYHPVSFALMILFVVFAAFYSFSPPTRSLLDLVAVAVFSELTGSCGATLTPQDQCRFTGRLQPAAQAALDSNIQAERAAAEAEQVAQEAHWRELSAQALAAHNNSLAAEAAERKPPRRTARPSPVQRAPRVDENEVSQQESPISSEEVRADREVQAASRAAYDARVARDAARDVVASKAAEYQRWLACQKDFLSAGSCGPSPNLR